MFGCRKRRLARLFTGPLLFVVLTRHWFSAHDTPVGNDMQLSAVKNTIDNALDHFIETSGSIGSKSDDVNHIITVQNRLSCLIQNADWESRAQYSRLVPNPNCQIPDHNDLCEQLAGRKIVLVGPDTTYYLHSVWLESQENHNHDCPGRDYCTFHHICLAGQKAPTSMYGSATRKKKEPSGAQLKDSNTSLMRYIHSSTLFMSQNQLDPGYRAPYVDEDTGVKQSNNFWYKQAHKADVLVINRPPLPAPASTYNDSSLFGNLAFASRVCGESLNFTSSGCGSSLNYDLAMVALEATLERFIPAVIATLQQIVADPAFRNTRLVWQGSWYIQASCSRIGLSRTVPLVEGFWFQAGAMETAMDPWSLYYNAQVYMHDRILPRILPHFNITYLPLSFPMFDETTDIYIEDDLLNAPSERQKDCIRNPWSTYGLDLNQAFLKGLSVLLTLHDQKGRF